MQFLYHASPVQGLTTLKPQKRFAPEGMVIDSAIYASPKIEFAATHGFTWTTDEGIDLSIYDGKITLTIPKDMRDRLLIPLSIYKISDEDFVKTVEETTGLTWHTEKTVAVINETKFASAEDALAELGVDVHYI